MLKDKQGGAEMKLPGPDRCCGCTACVSACRVGAITMCVDEEGFLQPKVDNEKCVNCKRCATVCPVNNTRLPVCPNCYIAKSPHEDILKGSSSGGVFSELAIHVLNGGGCVVGCVMDVPRKKAVHKLIECVDSLGQMQGSKYIQSEMGDVFLSAKQQLERGRKVLFSGTPCQVDGFKRYVGREDDNLLCVEVVCHGVGSPKIFQKFLVELEQTRGARVMSVLFRKKQLCASGSAFVVEFDGPLGERFVAPAYGSAYGKAFMQRLCLRRSCDHCPSKHGLSGADITIGDYWGGKKFHADFDQTGGASFVAVWTKKGEHALMTSELVLEKSRWGWGVAMNPSLYRSGVSDEKMRERLFSAAQSSSVGNAVDKILSDSTHEHVCQRLLHRVCSVMNRIMGRRLTKEDEALYSRIGIKTVSRTLLLTNYGSFYQHYALRKLIKSFGYVPFRLEVSDSLRHELFDWLMPIRCLRIKVRAVMGLYKGLVDSITVRDIITRWAFISDYRKMIGPLFEKDSSSVYAYVAGGDSIWFGTDPSNFLMNMARGIPRLSYAASSAWDKAATSDDWRNLVKCAVKDFTAISVREQYGVNIIKEIAPEISVFRVVDPVFHLCKDELSAMAGAKRMLRSSTVFGYFVNVYSKEDANFESLKELANSLFADLKIVGVQNAGKYIPHGYRVRPSPSQFLRCMIDSEWIVTNSFHGLVFALILHKPFAFVEQRSVRYGNHNLRQHELLQSYGLSDHIVGTRFSPENIAAVLKKQVDWEAIQKRLDTNISYSKEWLQNNLDMAARKEVY